MSDNQDHFNVLRKINSKPKATQRELADELGFSLGKLNYCLRALKTKGLIKFKNFEKNPNKLNYIYVLTTRGITEKTKLTYMLANNMVFLNQILNKKKPKRPVKLNNRGKWVWVED